MSEEEEKLSVKIRCVNPEDSSTVPDVIALNFSSSVSDIKSEIYSKTQIPISEQKLIYKGKVLKDEDSMKDITFKNNDTMVYMRSRKKITTPSGNSGAGGSKVGNSGNLQNDGNSEERAESESNSGSRNPTPGLMNNPAVQRILSDNPEIRRVMQDPEIMRETMQMMSNPSLYQERLRQNDLAMNQLEAHPRGYDALRSLYTNVQRPMQEALQNQTAQSTTNTNSVTNNDSNNNNSDGNSGTQINNPFASTSRRPNTMPGGFSDGGNFGMPPVDFNQLANMLEQPGMSEMMQQMLSNPELIRQMSQMNPQLQGASSQLFSNPESMRWMLNPNTLRMMANLTQNTGQNQNSSNQSPASGTPNQNMGMPDMSEMFRNFGNLQGLNLGGLPGQSPVRSNLPPEERFAVQLTQLEGMGFMDRESNLRVLESVNGDVNAAIDRLLGMM